MKHALHGLLALALLGAGLLLSDPVGPATAEAQEERVEVSVWLVGRLDQRALAKHVERSLRGLPVRVEIEHSARLPNPPPARQAFVIALALEQRQAVVYHLEPDTEPKAVRRVPVQGRVDAATRSVLGRVVRTTVEGLLAQR